MNTAQQLSAAEIEAIGQEDDFHIAVLREDGKSLGHIDLDMECCAGREIICTGL